MCNHASPICSDPMAIGYFSSSSVCTGTGFTTLCTTHHESCERANAPLSIVTTIGHAADLADLADLTDLADLADLIAVAILLCRRALIVITTVLHTFINTNKAKIYSVLEITTIVKPACSLCRCDCLKDCIPQKFVRVTSCFSG